MNKEEKAAAVEEIAQRLGEAEAIFAVDYRGISVTEAAELRSSLREADATFRVVKNRLAKRAAEQAGTNELQDLLDGPIALTFVKGDAVIAAKAIATFARQHDVLEYRGGIMDGEPLDPDKFGAIARLPGLDVLHGQLVGVTASPLTGPHPGPRRDDLRPRGRPRPDRREGPGRRGRRAGGRGGARRRGGEGRGAPGRGDGRGAREPRSRPPRRSPRPRSRPRRRLQRLQAKAKPKRLPRDPRPKGPIPRARKKPRRNSQWQQQRKRCPPRSGSRS